MGVKNKPRNRVIPTGVISPVNWYTRRGLRDAMGIGHYLLAEMRSKGVLPVRIGNACWYRGSDVIAWIESQAKSQSLLSSQH